MCPVTTPSPPASSGCRQEKSLCLCVSPGREGQSSCKALLALPPSFRPVPEGRCRGGGLGYGGSGLWLGGWGVGGTPAHRQWSLGGVCVCVPGAAGRGGGAGGGRGAALRPPGASPQGVSCVREGGCTETAGG